MDHTFLYLLLEVYLCHLSILQHLSRASDGVRRLASVDRGHGGVPPRMERRGRAAMVVRRRVDSMGAAAAVAGRCRAGLSSIAVRRQCFVRHRLRDEVLQDGTRGQLGGLLCDVCRGQRQMPQLGLCGSHMPSATRVYVWHT